MSTEGETPTSTGKSYRPRESRYRGIQIRAHAERVRRLTEVWEGGRQVVRNALPENWRSWTLFDLSHCRHTVCSIFEVENEHGVWGVEICNNCGTLVQRACPHVSNSWNEEGTVLTCDNCGMDGT